MDGRTEYAADAPITAEQFVDLLRRSTLAERRPVEDRECIAGMLANAAPAAAGYYRASAWRRIRARGCWAGAGPLG